MARFITQRQAKELASAFERPDTSIVRPKPHRGVIVAETVIEEVADDRRFEMIASDPQSLAYHVRRGEREGFMDAQRSKMQEFHAEAITRHVRYAPESSQREIRERFTLLLMDNKLSQRMDVWGKLSEWVRASRDTAKQLGAPRPDILSFRGPDGGFEIPPEGLFTHSELALIARVAKERGIPPTGSKDAREASKRSGFQSIPRARKGRPPAAKAGPAETGDGDAGGAAPGYGSWD